MKNQLRELLADKSPEIHSTGTDVSVMDAVRDMNYCNVGALIVLDHDKVVGVFSERDVMARVVAADLDPVTTKVAQVMTRDPVCVSPDISVEAAMSLVTEKRFRHLPVVEYGVLCGVISSGDLMRWMVRDQKHQIDDLNAYITDTHIPPFFSSGDQ